MVVSLKRVFLLIILVLALLTGLLGWSMKAMTTPMLRSHPGATITSRQFADDPNRVNCPPPPYSCW